jgi:hypothetical protein
MFPSPSKSISFKISFMFSFSNILYSAYSLKIYSNSSNVIDPSSFLSNY